MSSLPSFQRTEVAGLPVYWTEAPPPSSASLSFRVGRADETLTTSGITHLIEHLALFGVGPKRFTIDGFVENARVVLYAEGTREEVLEFLANLSGAIQALPVDRLERERQVLLTEAESWSPSVVEGLMSLRFGAHFFGLAGYPEYGLHCIEEKQVGSWAAERFTNGNAAVWMTGPPRDFEIDLPPGPRLPPPEPAPIPGLELPAHLSEGEGGVAVSFLGMRSTALRSGLAIAADRARQRLRLDKGLSYDIHQDYEPLGADVAHLTIGADCLDRHALAVRDELLQVLTELAAEGPTEPELEKHFNEARRTMEDTRNVQGELDTAVANELLGAPVPTRAELLTEIQALTPGDLARALSEVSDSAIVIAPQDVPPPDKGYRVYEPPGRNRLTGRTYYSSLLSHLPPLRTRADRLISAPEGISVVDAGGEELTIRYADCIAVLVRPDRSMEVIGNDGSSIELNFEAFPKGKQLLAEIREHIPSELFVPMEDEAKSWLAVEKVASRKLRRRWIVSDELDVLAAKLGSSETVLNLAEANRGLRGGLLAVTDRRLIFLYEGVRKKEVLDLPCEKVVSIETRRGSRRFSSTEIDVMTSDERITFKEIVPSERAAEIVEEVTARLRNPPDGHGSRGGNR